MSAPEVDNASVLAQVRGTDWQAWAIPLPDRLFAYDPGSVVPAFEALVLASSPEYAFDAYNGMLDAIAHNHSGTPYAAMAPAAELLAARKLGPLARHWLEGSDDQQHRAAAQLLEVLSEFDL